MSDTSIRRRIEKFLANPNCKANALAAVHGIPMDLVARAEGAQPKLGISPFARQRGFAFEKKLFASHGEVLREALVRADALPGNARGFSDLRTRSLGGSCQTMQDSAVAFQELLSGQPSFEGLVVGPCLALATDDQLPGGMLGADFLLVYQKQGQRMVTVGEIKSYPDLEGFTDASQLSGARAQAGLYLYALGLMSERLSLDILLNDRGVLVLAKPGLAANRPSVRTAEDLRWQSERAARALEQLRIAAAETAHLKDIDPSSDEAVDLIQRSETCFVEHCLRFCERVDSCRRQALQTGNPMILGEDVVQLLASMSLPRALEIIEGATPGSDMERDFVQRVARVRAYEV